MSGWRVIDGRPCPADIAPYVAIVLRDAGQTASAIYRGDNPEARAILNAHGGHTQKQLASASSVERVAWGIEGTPNRPGFSQHELFDQDGHPLPSWHVGVDSGSDSRHDKLAIVNAAKAHGWKVAHPYKSVVEGHHWCFIERPKPHSLRMRARIIHLRATLPRR